MTTVERLEEEYARTRAVANAYAQALGIVKARSKPGAEDFLERIVRDANRFVERAREELASEIAKEP